jgi:hypothetical protein
MPVTRAPASTDAFAKLERDGQASVLGSLFDTAALATTTQSQTLNRNQASSFRALPMIERSPIYVFDLRFLVSFCSTDHHLMQVLMQ